MTVAKNTQDHRALLTVREFCDATGVGRRTIDARLRLAPKDGGIKHMKVGRKSYILKHEVDDWPQREAARQAAR